MTLGQRFARLVTTIVVRVPVLWRLFRGPLTRNFDRLAPTWDALRVTERLCADAAALAAVEPDAGARARRRHRHRAAARALAAACWPEAEVVGVDVSRGDDRRGAARSRRPTVSATRSPTHRALPFPDGSFDLVTLDNMIPFFDELARVTAPGGHVAIAFSRGAADADLGAARARSHASSSAAASRTLRTSARDRPLAPCPQGPRLLGFVATGTFATR